MCVSRVRACVYVCVCVCVCLGFSPKAAAPPKGAGVAKFKGLGKRVMDANRPRGPSMSTTAVDALQMAQVDRSFLDFLYTLVSSYVV